jgi:hypothetical protein
MARAGCTFIVHFKMSFSKTSFRRSISKAPLEKPAMTKLGNWLARWEVLGQPGGKLPLATEQIQ